METMGGELAVESDLGQGSRFIIRLPFQLAEADSATPDAIPAPAVIGLQADQPEWRVLVVDDNRENRLLLTNLLTQVGFTVQEADNGATAVAAFQAWRPDFIWMDMRMPVLDGYAATEQIRALPGGDAVKIVAATASVLAEEQDDIRAAGCDDTVRKPFHDYEIFEAMARHLGVEYRYEEAEGTPSQVQRTDITVEMLAALPR